MTFQLRRMVLVNAGTNKHVASGRITEVDPRGGAAVVGANAVGKTFTLRLIPLFFGHPTRELVALDKGQEGTSFIFPSLTSAVCFEYQRGSDRQEELRLVVMRARADGSDAPEYRIFPTAFNKELFVHDNRFLTDEGTEARARALGIVPTKKLTTSEYRSVILRSGFTGQDAKKLHGYALAHSFGPKPLPNLDKLVATMVKKSIRFDELVAVAVGLVQDELGLETMRGTLKMRQQRGELERWMRNLDAGRRAVALEPRINGLRGMLLDLHTYEREWRERHHDVDVLIELRSRERERIDAAIVVADHERAAAAALERTNIAARDADALEAGTQSSAARRAHEEALNKQLYFHKGRAEHWALEQARLEPLRNERLAIHGQLESAQAAAQSARLSNAHEVARVERATADSRRVLEAGKDPLRSRHDHDLQALTRSESEALGAMERELDARKEELELQKAPLDTRLGALQAAIANPAVPQALQDAAKDITRKLLDLGVESNIGSACATRAGQAVHKSQSAFDAAELQLKALRRRVEQALAGVTLAQSWTVPESGTLLSALRGHPDEGWKRDLARVLNPDLLSRSDLNPHALPEGVEESAYGWMLDLAAIETPQWADEYALREALTRAKDVLDAARRTESEYDEKLLELSKILERAREALLEADSAVSVAGGRRTSLVEALREAEDALEHAKIGVKARVQAEHGQIKVQVNELGHQLAALKSDRERLAKAIRAEHGAQRERAGQRRNAAIESIDQAIGAIEAQKGEQLQALEDQLHAQLSEKGVDIKALGGLQERIRSIDKQIAALTNSAPLVEAYRTWLSEVGPDTVAHLQRMAETAARQAESAANSLEAVRRAARDAQNAHDKRMSEARQRSGELEADINKLTPLLDVFGDYLAVSHERVDTTMKVEEMRRVVHEQHKALKTFEQGLHRSFTDCHRELTMTESTVKQLIDGSLEGQAGDEKTHAQLLVSAYRRLGEQVVGELNNSLGTVLNQIGQFRRRIASFESEVGKFNTLLQKALGEITRFERLADFKLNIVADFTELDFYGKLKRMDEVIRRHQSEFSIASSTQLPPIETIEALRDFMGVLGSEGMLEVDLARHIRLHGSVIENGQARHFKRASELENISSTGLTTLILITLLVGLVQVVRRGEPVHVPWVTDEVGTFDAANFKALLELLKDNRIDVITASPALDSSQLAHFAQRYLFLDRGEICRYVPKGVTA